ncbi:MAG: electron transport complex subunit RsxD [Gammaproteobacteria bacterium]|jgi:electron transport complex protein RnfD|nr:electron transport complex subunit RsxD [Gammaproteobacteria bacterium]
MKFPTETSPHVISHANVPSVMRQVAYALVPGTAAMAWYFGWGVLFNIVIAVTVALASEAAVLRLRNRPVQPALTDCSAILTGWLLALALPPLIPWWLTALGTGFAIVVAKQLYGGLGHNPFNPAMTGYVVLIISFPAELTQWPPPGMLAEVHFGPLETLGIILTGELPNALTWDSVTQATPLDTMRTHLGLYETLEEIRQSPIWGDFGGRGWEWIGNWYLIGGLWLVFRKVVDWRIPAGVLGGLILISTFFYLADPDIHPFPAFHVFSGGVMLGAFFIATDPVSASGTPLGRLIYGAGIGVLIYVIRTWGGYPDAVAFAVLLMNAAAPMIDQYTRPRTYGHDPAGE